MKIAVISHARSGSTKLTAILSNIFKIQNLREIISDESFEEKIKKLQVLTLLDNYVVKFRAVSLMNVLPNQIDWGMFDLIFSTTRTNLIDTFISQQFAVTRGNWTKYTNDIWNINPMIIDVRLVPGWYWVNIMPLNNILIEITQRINGIISNFTYDEIKTPEETGQG